MKTKLRKYLKPYWMFAVMSPLAMCGEVWIDLILPKLMSRIVDEGVVGGDSSVIFSTGIVMMVLAIVGGVAGLASAAFASAASQSFGNDLRCDTFERIMRLSPQQTDKFTTGSLITRISNDVSAIQDFISMALRMFFRAPTFFIGGILMTISLNASFSAVIFCALPAIIIIVVILLLKSSPLFGIVQRKLDKLNGVVQENVTGARVVKSNVREDHEIERFTNANAELMQSTYKVQKFMAILMPIMSLIMNVAVIAIIYIGGTKIQADLDAGIAGMTVGDVMAAVTYITQILMSVMMISMMFQSVSRASASAARVREVLDTVPVIRDGGASLENGEIESIEFSNVSFHYPGFSEKPVLENINLKIERGTTVAILGSTGTGKTTLVSLIARYYDTTDGEVLINGRNVKEYDLCSIREHIGYVLQKSELFSGTISENIRWGREDATDEEVREAAVIAQADEYISGFNDGYNTMVDEKGASLSGGQKQRLAIARALIKKPSVLIFDDSTSALDLGTEARLKAALREKCGGITQIVIAQRVASVKSADKIVVIDNGRIVSVGTHKELLETSEVYKDICDSQKANGGEGI